MLQRSKDSIYAALPISSLLVTVLQVESTCLIENIGLRKMIGFPFFYYWIPNDLNEGSDFLLLPFLFNFIIITIIVFIVCLLLFKLFKNTLNNSFSKNILNLIQWSCIIVVFLPILFLYFSRFIDLKIWYDQNFVLLSKNYKIVFNTWFTWKNN
jgi:nitrogen fixation/metabolism regulation signal transduction histidine kinase